MADFHEGQPTQDLCSILRSQLQSGNVILLGAPAVGKTTFLEKAGISTVTSLGELGSHADEIIALDPGFDIYLEYDGTSNNRLEKHFDQMLTRESGVCISLTPYEFDWLVSKTELSDRLTEPNQFDIIGLQFDSEAAVTEAQKIDGLQSVAVDHILERCIYEYTLDAKSIPEDEAYTYRTYLPHVIREIAVKGVDEIVLPGDIVPQSQSGKIESLREIAEEIVVSDAVGHLKNAMMNAPDLLQSIDGESIRQLGTGALVASAPTVAPAALSISVALALSTGDDEPGVREQYEQQLGILLTDNTVSPTRELLEQTLNAPPGTLAAMDATRTREFRVQVSHLADRLESMDADFRSINNQVTALGEELTTLAENVSVITAAVEKSVCDIETVLGKSLRSNEQKLLRQKSGDDTLLGLDTSSESDDVIASISDGGSVTVVTGPHGIGKSTTLYQTGKQLESEGATVLVPDIRGGRVDFETVKRALRSQEFGRTVLMVSYREGPREMTVDDVDQIGNLIQLLDDGLCTEIIVESRIELLSNFTSEYRRARRSVADTTVPEPLEIHRCKPLDDDSMRNLAREVSQFVGDELLNENELNRVVDVAEGVPEIGKIAARLFSEGRDLEGVHTAREVVWYDLEPLVNRFDKHSDVRRILRLLATFRSLSRDELLSLTHDGFDLVDLEETQRELDGYVRIEQGEDTDIDQWRLRPSVYTDVVFQQDCFEVVPQLVKTTIPKLAPTTIASAMESLAIAYQTAENQSNQPEQFTIDPKRVIEKVNQVLRHVEEYGDGETYLQVLSRVGRIPIDLESLNTALIAAPDGSDGLNLGIARQRIAEERVDFNTETTVINSNATDTIEVLSGLVTNHLESETEANPELINKTVNQLITHAEAGPGPDVRRRDLDSLVRTHVYSHCLDIHFSRLNSDGDRADDQILSEAVAFYDNVLTIFADVATEFGLFAEDSVILLSSPFRILTIDWEIEHVIECYCVALQSVKTLARKGNFLTGSSPDMPMGPTDSHGDEVHTFVTLTASIPPLFTLNEMSTRSAIAFYRYAENDINPVLSQHNRDLADVSFDARERGLSKFNGLMIWGFSSMYPDEEAEFLVTQVVDHLSSEGYTPSSVPTFVSMCVAEAIKYLINIRTEGQHDRLIDGLAQQSRRSLQTAQELGMEIETFAQSSLYYLDVYTSILDAIMGTDLEGESETEQMHRLTIKRIIIVMSTIVDPEDIPYILKSTYDRGMNRYNPGWLSMILYQSLSESMQMFGVQNYITDRHINWLEFVQSENQPFLRPRNAIMYAIEDTSVEETADWIVPMINRLRRVSIVDNTATENPCRGLLEQINATLRNYPPLGEEVNKRLS